MHSGEDNIAHVVYKEIRKKFLEGAFGYIHEIFNICCKYRCIDIWHGKCPKTINPLAQIRRIVEAHQLQLDLQILHQSNSAYSKPMKIIRSKMHP